MCTPVGPEGEPDIRRRLRLLSGTGRRREGGDRGVESEKAVSEEESKALGSEEDVGGEQRIRPAPRCVTHVEFERVPGRSLRSALLS